ncbi:MAG: GDP-L-fucose synthase [Candidatus Dependentiae bacterium]|nr:GDP-L-fucose synthase [Candidatus Dependentiae bacterium]
MEKDAKIYVAGHKGLVGSAIVRQLKSDGYTNIVVAASDEVDLRNQAAVNSFFEKEKPEYVFLAAAKVGGIQANIDYPAQFIYNNTVIEANVIHASYLYGVKKLLFLGSSCIYPRNCPQPIKEEYLLTSELEKSNEPYAIAKIVGLKMCEAYNREYKTNFIACMPTNLYGQNDNFDLRTSHVLPALIAKMYRAKQENAESVTVWGSGTPYREFLYVDDLASATVFLMNHYEGSDLINIGMGQDVTIKEVAETIKEIVGFEGELIFDTSKPDGTPRKLLNVDRLKSLGWQAQTTLENGIEKTVTWCQENNIF